MKRRLSSWISPVKATVAALVVAAVAFGVRDTARAGDGDDRAVVCLSPNATQDAIRTNKARRLAEFRHLLDGEIVRADLCPADDGLVYRVTVLTGNGMVRRVVLDAQSGRLMYTGR